MQSDAQNALETSSEELVFMVQSKSDAEVLDKTITVNLFNAVIDHRVQCACRLYGFGYKYEHQPANLITDQIKRNS